MIKYFFSKYILAFFLASFIPLSASAINEHAKSAALCSLDLRGLLGGGAEDQNSNDKKTSIISIFSGKEKKLEKEPEVLSEYGSQFEKGSRESELFEAMPRGGFSKISFCFEQISLRTKALQVIAARQDGRVKQLMKDDKDLIFIGKAAKDFDSVNDAIKYYQANNDATNSAVLQMIYTDVMVAKYLVNDIVFYGNFLIAAIPNVLELELDEFNSSMKDFNRDIKQLIESPLDLFNGGFNENFNNMKDSISGLFTSKKKKFQKHIKSIQENTVEILSHTNEIGLSVTKLMDTFLKGLKEQVQAVDSVTIQNEVTEFLAGLVTEATQ